MKRILLAFSLLIPSVALAAQEAGSFGLGGVLGDPIGIDGKYWINNKAAVDGLIGFHYGGRPDHYCSDGYYWTDSHGTRHWNDGDCGDHWTRFEIHSDFLYHFDPFPISRGRLPLNVGLGLRLLAPDTNVGLRIPFGISYLFAGAPVDLFAEIAPVIVFAPYSDLDIDGGVGVRFYFGK